MVKITIDHNNLHFCSGPCGMLSNEYSIQDSNNTYLFELKPYNGNRYPKITYKRLNNDILEVINCRICAICHKKNLDLNEENEIEFLDKDSISVMKKFVLLEVAEDNVIQYLKNDNKL